MPSRIGSRPAGTAPADDHSGTPTQADQVSEAISDWFQSPALNERTPAYMLGTFDDAARDAYKESIRATSQGTLRFMGEAGDALSPSEAAVMARSVSALRNELRAMVQATLSPGGKLMSEVLERNRDWAEIVGKYGNPFDSSKSTERRCEIAEAIVDAAGKSRKLMATLQYISRGLLALDALRSGAQIGRGIDHVANGKTAEGVIDVAEGSSNLGLTAGTAWAARAGIVVGEAGAAGSAVLAAAATAAAGSIALAAETARAAVAGEKTPLEVADEYYGTRFSDIAGWISGDP